jgi:hypothetical protein
MVCRTERTARRKTPELPTTAPPPASTTSPPATSLNKRILKKKVAPALRPIKRIEITEEQMQARCDRLLQRVRRHNEHYVIVCENGRRAVMMSHEWAEAVKLLSSLSPKRAARLR